jgi:hypothetical protein
VFLNFWMTEWLLRLAPGWSVVDRAADLRVFAFSSQFIDMDDVPSEVRYSPWVEEMVKKTSDDIFLLKYADKPAVVN